MSFYCSDGLIGSNITNLFELRIVNICSSIWRRNFCVFFKDTSNVVGLYRENEYGFTNISIILVPL